MKRFIFTLLSITSLLFVSAAADSAVYNALTAKKSYPIMGTFGEHDFAQAQKAFDWAFTLTSNSKSYQLQGKPASDTDVFGWKEVSIETPKPAWYMFALDGDVDRDGSQKFDWILVGVNTQAVYKLAGVSDNGTFLYSDPIDIEYTVNNNTVTFLGNPNAPVAQDITLKADASTPYMQIDLIATDPNNDTISFFLDSPINGSSELGYSLAFIEEGTHSLYVTFDDNRSKVVTLSYVATDGQFFSQPATITITKGDVVSYGYGANEISPEEYGRITLAYFDGNRFASADIDDQDFPTSIDLSSSMPLPGNQGQQNSCVAWAVGYALKSYHEKMELQWSLDSSKTIFSPAWIYNQINHGKDEGSSVKRAMELLINKGAATLHTMPYSDRDYTTQPTAQALNEALNFRAAKYRRIGGERQIKAALANRQPVVILIKVYDSFNTISGENSVYATLSGEYYGYHGVTIVGYDDEKFGGAFKVINSWGREWGDKGYFWIPYSKVRDIIRTSYVLSDAKNGEDIVIDVPTKPVDERLPNLQVTSWYLEYNEVGGALIYEVANTGNSIAYPGADINLMFSKDAVIDNSDYYLIYETIETALTPGMAIYRTQDNPGYFAFPDNLEAGEYYMAMWVDDLDVIEESNETDNKSLSELGTITVKDQKLPDLAIDWWYTDYNSDGLGVLVYEISNSGTATSYNHFDVNLILSTTETLSEETTGYYLYSETVNMTLEPETVIVRDEENPAFYDLFHAQNGTEVAAGEYYIIFWIDDQGSVAESNELNNYSVSNDGVRISYTTTRSHALSTPAKIHFNGKHLTKQQTQILQKVRVSYDENGTRHIRALKNDLHIKKDQLQKQPIYTKTLHSANQIIFPINKKVPMP